MSPEISPLSQCQTDKSRGRRDSLSVLCAQGPSERCQLKESLKTYTNLLSQVALRFSPPSLSMAEWPFKGPLICVVGTRVSRLGLPAAGQSGGLIGYPLKAM